MTRIILLTLWTVTLVIGGCAYPNQFRSVRANVPHASLAGEQVKVTHINEQPTSFWRTQEGFRMSPGRTTVRVISGYRGEVHYPVLEFTAEANHHYTIRRSTTIGSDRIVLRDGDHIMVQKTAKSSRDVPKSMTQRKGPQETFSLPTAWTRRGVVLERQQKDKGVSGDPCIVWDEAIQGWRMVLFYDPPGHAQAICTNRDDLGPGQWKLEGPLAVTNPQAVGGFHKPFFVMDPHHPNQAARIDGRYCLLVVSFKDGHKQIQRAWSEQLAGPWTFEAEAIIPIGAPDDFDAKHTDAVTGYYFPERKEFLYFYMGYPRQAQSRASSPFGSAQAVATQKLGDKAATKHGVVLEPCQQAGHWASGWVGGLQLLPGREHRWVAVVNASPTAPDPGNKEVWTEEPAPSLGGFAWCDEAWPVKGWHFAPEPIEWVKDIPKSALEAGEGYNLWRQFIHVLPDGRAALFYNSGYYGREQLYMKVGDKP